MPFPKKQPLCSLLLGEGTVNTGEGRGRGVHPAITPCASSFFQWASKSRFLNGVSMLLSVEAKSRPHPWLQPYWKKGQITRLREGAPALEWVLTDSLGIPQSWTQPWPRGVQNSCHSLFVCPCKTALVRLERGSQYSLGAKIFCMITWSPHCISVSPGWSWEPLRGAGEALGTERRCRNVSETSWLPTSLFSQKEI